jgi:glycine/D-amino acid oxidase-like deaminating enzyme
MTHSPGARSELDVIVIGGGIQGLLALGALVEKGYSCALVSDGDLGSGQTLHSHGFLNSGFGFSGPELQQASMEVVQPDLLQRGLELSQDWVFIPPPGFPVPDGLPPATLPPGFDSSLGATAVQWPDRSFPKRRLVESLSQDHLDRILVGHATPAWSGGRVDSVTVRLAGDGADVVLATRALVVAAGCGTKRIVQGLVGPTPQVEQIQHRRVHMICVRGPRGALSTTSVAAMPLGLLLAAHENEDDVTWYVTPLEFGGQSFDDVPEDAASDADPDTVVRGCLGLIQLFPGLPDVKGLKIGCYAGYRQDIGPMPGNRLCQLVDGSENVVMALPSGLIGPWLNAAAIGEIIGGLVEPSATPTPLPTGGAEVRVGDAVEDRPDFSWMSWEEWLRNYPRLSEKAPAGRH